MKVWKQIGRKCFKCSVAYLVYSVNSFQRKVIIVTLFKIIICILLSKCTLHYALQYRDIEMHSAPIANGLNIYRWYKVKHIYGSPGCLCKSVFKNNFAIKLLTNICLKGFIMICVKFGSDCSLKCLLLK